MVSCYDPYVGFCIDESNTETTLTFQISKQFVVPLSKIRSIVDSSSILA